MYNVCDVYNFPYCYNWICCAPLCAFKEIEKLQVELNEYKLRLEQALQDTARAKEECLKQTELLGKAEHQLHLTRYTLSYMALAPISILYCKFLPAAYPQLLEIDSVHSFQAY